MEKILVIDTETASGFAKPMVYDFGFAVTDRTGHIYEKGCALVWEVFKDPYEMNTAYYKEKVPMYNGLVAQGKMKILHLVDIYKYVQNLIKKHNIKAIAAYNATFDINALNCTIDRFSRHFITEFFPKELLVYCIWSMACSAIYNTTTFQKEAIKKGWLTEKGNFKTSAEIGYRFLKREDDFDEDHVALSDVLIEIEIMVACFNKHVKLAKLPDRACWRKIPKKVTKI